MKKVSVDPEEISLAPHPDLEIPPAWHQVNGYLSKFYEKLGVEERSEKTA
jgi:hypothetical protein